MCPVRPIASSLNAVRVSGISCCTQAHEFVDVFMKTAEKTWGEEQNAVYA